jgi:hypothetical protein
MIVGRESGPAGAPILLARPPRHLLFKFPRQINAGASFMLSRLHYSPLAPAMHGKPDALNAFPHPNLSRETG